MLLISLVAPSAHAAPCPNQAFRTGLSAALPECRAYEQLTPTYKEGTVGAPENLIAASPDREHLLVESFGTVNGSSQTSSFQTNVYELSRAGSGWVTSPRDPDARQYVASRPAGAQSADLSRILWEMHTATESGETQNLFIGEPDGRFVFVGPPVPPAATEHGKPGEGFANSTPASLGGASADLSHIVFTINSSSGGAYLWPGDSTLAGESLYEFEGLYNAAPRLVAVSGGAGSSDLISQCGALLGSGGPGGGSRYGAISSGGTRVYFTAQGTDVSNCGGTEPPVQELFLREDAARTLPVSEPSLEYCATHTCRDANFEGASEDGSRVFFTSTQKLTEAASEDETAGDSAWSGCSETTGTGCNLYLRDFSGGAPGQLTAISAGDPAGPRVQGVARISHDGSTVYFVAKGVLAANAGPAIDPIAEAPEQAEEGAENLYVYRAGAVSFIARLSEADTADWRRADRRPVQATPDGRYLLFRSSARLTADNHSVNPETAEGLPQLFEYDAQTEELARVSVGEDRYNDNGNITSSGQAPNMEFPKYLGGSGREGQFTSLSISDNGAAVVFSSAAVLSPLALNSQALGCENAYVYRSAGAISNGTAHLISDGRETTIKVFKCGSPLTPLIGASGRDIYFGATDSLAPSDTDTQWDLYDAREGGGFATPATAAPCQGDACQGALSPPPPPPAPNSTGAGPGNPKPSTKCKKGFVKRQGKCVKKKTQKHKKSHNKRTASHKRGGNK